MRESKRKKLLNELIEEKYGELGPYEIDFLEPNYDETTTRMIEITKIFANRVNVVDIHDDMNFLAVSVEPDLLKLLGEGDVFLSTLGSLDDEWSLIYLSPLYEYEVIDYGEEDLI